MLYFISFTNTLWWLFVVSVSIRFHSCYKQIPSYLRYRSGGTIHYDEILVHSKPITHDVDITNEYKSKVFTLPYLNRSFNIYEAKDVDKAVNDAINQNQPEPFGLFTWNSSYTAAYVMDIINHRSPGYFQGKIVCDLGCGTGLTTVVALAVGAQVISLDNNEKSLRLTELNSKESIPDANLRTSLYDISCGSGLPSSDILIMSDILYYESLALKCAELAAKAVSDGSQVLVTDPGRYTNQLFLERLQKQVESDQILSFSVTNETQYLHQTKKFQNLNRIEADTIDKKGKLTKLGKYLWIGREYSR